MLTIAELPHYIREAEKLLSLAERVDIINYLAAHPKSGDLMEGTGGVRMTLYLLTLFAKNERANLSKAERKELADLVNTLVGIWTGH